MNKKERLNALKEEAKEFAEKMNTANADDVKKLTEYKSSIAALEAEIKADEARVELLRLIGVREKDAATGEKKNARTLGENFVEHVKAMKLGKKFNVVAPAFVKAATDVQTSPAAAVDYATTFDRNVVTAPRTSLVIRDLFGSETISGSTLVYLTEGAMEGSPAVTAEANKKAQVHFGDPVPHTVSLKKITEFIKESDEYINDYAFLASAINGRLVYALGLKEQNELVADLLATSGIQTDSSSWTASTDAIALADLIFGALADVESGSGYAADAVVMNPATWQIIRLGKYGSTNEYIGGGYFADGQGKQIWGIPVVTTTAVTANQIIVGAFKTCGSVVQNGGVGVEATNSNEDDFVKNLMTIRAEERLALAVRRPAGFKKLTKAS